MKMSFNIILQSQSLPTVFNLKTDLSVMMLLRLSLCATAISLCFELQPAVELEFLRVKNANSIP